MAGLWNGGSSLETERFVSLTEVFLGFLFFGFLAFLGKTHWKILLAAWGMLSLGIFAFSNLPSFDLVSWRAEGKAIQEKLTLGDGRLYWGSHNDRSLALGLPDIWGDDPLVPKRFSDFMAYRKDGPVNPSPDVQMLNLTPVKCALTRLAFFINRKDGQDQIAPSPFTRLPRAFLVGDWRKTAGPAETLPALSEKNFNPQKEVLLEEAPRSAPPRERGKRKNNPRGSFHGPP